jgi:hypothetical protein
MSIEDRHQHAKNRQPSYTRIAFCQNIALNLDGNCHANILLKLTIEKVVFIT